MKKDKEEDVTQWFYIDEHGSMGMGTDEKCHDEIWEEIGEGYDDCLFVTNQGVHVDVDDIVYIKTYKDMLKIRDRQWPNYDNVRYWLCSETLYGC